MASSRTYRLLAALLAVLLLGGNVPLLQHACTMMAQQMGQHHQPCSSHKEASTHHAGASQHASHANTDEQPCEDAPVMQADCCTIQAQQVEMEAVPLSLRSSKLLGAALAPAVPGAVLQPEAPRSYHHVFLDTGPPLPAAVSLHVLHASFLI